MTRAWLAFTEIQNRSWGRNLQTDWRHSGGLSRVRKQYAQDQPLGVLRKAAVWWM